MGAATPATSAAAARDSFLMFGVSRAVPATDHELASAAAETPHPRRGTIVLVNASHRLIAYGTLAPGRPNHHQLATLEGRWISGVVRGDLVNAGWGDELGYPALVLKPDGAPVDVQVFESKDLPRHWERLDDFEGPG